MISGQNTSQEALARENLDQIERLLSDLAELAKDGTWEKIPDIETELSGKLTKLRMTDWRSTNFPALIEQLRKIQEQLDISVGHCSVRLEQIKPLVDAFAKKPEPSPGNHVQP